MNRIADKVWPPKVLLMVVIEHHLKIVVAGMEKQSQVLKFYNNKHRITKLNISFLNGRAHLHIFPSSFVV